ncbi:MAG: hypothetical protein LC734_03410, partial [Acidobacteria bacterium]|nr:hypothetical protein [Acidobacteriota bacterium]
VLLLACTPSALPDFAIPKWRADKGVRIEDAYKHIYQATRGGEHAAPDRQSANAWLANEWKGLAAPAIDEPMWEPLCPDGRIGRLNLRPFKAREGKADELLEAFLVSAGEYRPDGAAFTNAWAGLGKRLKRKKIGKLDHKGWARLDAEMKKKNYPAIHHSSEYNKAHRPAYRILTAERAGKLIK